MTKLEKKAALYRKLHRWLDASVKAEAAEYAAIEQAKKNAITELDNLRALRMSSTAMYSDMRQLGMGADETQHLSQNYIAYLELLAKEKQQFVVEQEGKLSNHAVRLKRERAMRRAMMDRLELATRGLHLEWEKSEFQELRQEPSKRDKHYD